MLCEGNNSRGRSERLPRSVEVGHDCKTGMAIGIFMNELLNKTVYAIELSDDAEIIRFTTDAGPAIYYCEADCCSVTWIDTLENVYAMLGAKVNAVEELETYDVDPGTRQEYDRVYGYKLDTSKGTFKLIFRNSSNGYYGGDLRLIEDASNWWVETLDKAKFAPVTNDIGV